MSHISLKNVGITFSIYNAKTRSIKNELIRNMGGKIKEVDATISVRALDGISLEINNNDRIGIIGHNGAGKTTLLKLLSGIYEPTDGVINIDGRVSSITDITMGMDYENTGYDNIIMRCIFMGMTFKEAKEKAQEIIEFSELGDYIYLPARTYSTGMYMRLAFTIATSIVPNILILDEMIGTGDANFIAKARARTSNMMQKTDIVVISSHDLQVVQDICNIGIWMEKGKIRMLGKVEEVLSEYRKFS